MWIYAGSLGDIAVDLQKVFNPILILTSLCKYAVCSTPVGLLGPWGSPQVKKTFVPLLWGKSMPDSWFFLFMWTWVGKTRPRRGSDAVMHHAANTSTSPNLLSSLTCSVSIHCFFLLLPTLCTNLLASAYIPNPSGIDNESVAQGRPIPHRMEFHILQS